MNTYYFCSLGCLCNHEPVRSRPRQVRPAGRVLQRLHRQMRYGAQRVRGSVAREPTRVSIRRRSETPRRPVLDMLPRAAGQDPEASSGAVQQVRVGSRASSPARPAPVRPQSQRHVPVVQNGTGSVLHASVGKKKIRRSIRRRSLPPGRRLSRTLRRFPRPRHRMDGHRVDMILYTKNTFMQNALTRLVIHLKEQRGTGSL